MRRGVVAAVALVVVLGAGIAFAITVPGGAATSKPCSNRVVMGGR